MLVEKDGRVVSLGRSRIITTVVGTMMNLVDDGMAPQKGDRCTAVASPRAARRSLSRAPGLPPDTVNPLTGMRIQAGLAAALAGGRADRSCERCLFGSSATGGGRPERRSAIE
jgi:gamma-glutamyltranspeptidase